MTCGFNFCTFNIHSSFTVLPSCLSRIYLIEQCLLYVIVYVHGTSYVTVYVQVCTRDILSNRVCTRDIIMISNRVCTRMYTGHHIESCMYTYVHGTSYRIVYVHGTSLWYRIVYVHVYTRDIISNRICTQAFLCFSAYIDCITFNICWVFKLILIHYFNFIYLMSVCSWKLLNLIKEQNT